MSNIAAPAFFGAPLAGACALAAGSPPVQIFHDVGVKPAHPTAPVDAIAQKFCFDKGFTEAGAHLFIGFTESDGAIIAHFRQIACRTYEVTRIEKPDNQAKGPTIGG